MSKARAKELVALRAVQMLANMNMVHDDQPWRSDVDRLQEAVRLWEPSVAEVAELEKRLAGIVPASGEGQ